ncbi:MAG TPA: hypothetical protein PLS67_14055 [Accumulibacter sp.]|jgi:hypothetical protein|nr:hypothetical protein [Accumulibacter sp.]
MQDSVENVDEKTTRAPHQTMRRAMGQQVGTVDRISSPVSSSEINPAVFDPTRACCSIFMFLLYYNSKNG